MLSFNGFIQLWWHIEICTHRNVIYDTYFSTKNISNIMETIDIDFRKVEAQGP